MAFEYIAPDSCNTIVTSPANVFSSMPQFPTEKEVSIFFQKGIDKCEETQYHVQQLAGAN